MPPLVVVAAALVDEAGAQPRVLVQQRPLGKHHGGLWEFPGGKVEPGEAVGAALVRELAEELGITVDAADLEPVTFAASPPGEPQPGGLVLLLYRCRRWQGEPVPEPGCALQWVDAAGLAHLAVPATMPPLDIALCISSQILPRP